MNQRVRGKHEGLDKSFWLRHVMITSCPSATYSPVPSAPVYNALPCCCEQLLVTSIRRAEPLPVLSDCQEVVQRYPVRSDENAGLSREACVRRVQKKLSCKWESRVPLKSLWGLESCWKKKKPSAAGTKERPSPVPLLPLDEMGDEKGTYTILFINCYVWAKLFVSNKVACDKDTLMLFMRYPSPFMRTINAYTYIYASVRAICHMETDSCNYFVLTSTTGKTNRSRLFRINFIEQ